MTGPKISSWAMRMSLRTWANTVGGGKSLVPARLPSAVHRLTVALRLPAGRSPDSR